VIRYYPYGASTALTYITILGVLPTFWGYWVLTRKPTLGPVNMARTFNALVLNQVEDQFEASILLQRVDSRNIHNDLIPQSSEEEVHKSSKFDDAKQLMSHGGVLESEIVVHDLSSFGLELCMAST
jgi:hypothetical protein